MKMKDYERGVQKMINSVASEEKHENIYKQCVADQAIVHIKGQDVSGI